MHLLNRQSGVGVGWELSCMFVYQSMCMCVKLYAFVCVAASFFSLLICSLLIIFGPVCVLGSC